MAAAREIWKPTKSAVSVVSLKFCDAFLIVNDLEARICRAYYLNNFEEKVFIFEMQILPHHFKDFQ
jgi:hypothetical protein